MLTTMIGCPGFEPGTTYTDEEDLIAGLPGLDPAEPATLLAAETGKPTGGC